MYVGVKSNIDAVLSGLLSDISLLPGHGVQGVIENHKEYSAFVNWGTSRQKGQFFIENSIPGIERIAQQEFGNIRGIPTAEDVKRANDETMHKGLMQEIIPRTPRSNIDHVHMQDDYEIHTSEIY